MRTKKQNRQEWMTQWEIEVLKRRPDYAGKLDWNSAVYHYGSGYSPEDAAVRYVSIPR